MSSSDNESAFFESHSIMFTAVHSQHLSAWNTPLSEDDVNKIAQDFFVTKLSAPALKRIKTLHNLETYAKTAAYGHPEQTVGRLYRIAHQHGLTGLVEAIRDSYNSHPTYKGV